MSETNKAIGIAKDQMPVIMDEAMSARPLAGAALIEQAMSETTESGSAECVETRDGRRVRIYCTDGRHPYSVHGAYMLGSDPHNCWMISTWHRDGNSLPDPGSKSDLVTCLPLWLALGAHPDGYISAIRALAPAR